MARGASRGAIVHLLTATAAFACTVPTAGKPFQIFSLPSPPVFTAQRPSPEEEALASEEARRRAVAAADARAEAEADRTSRELLCATVGLDRGTLATGAEAARVEAAVAAFEAVAACTLQAGSTLYPYPNPNPSPSPNPEKPCRRARRSSARSPRRVRGNSCTAPRSSRPQQRSPTATAAAGY